VKIKILWVSAENCGINSSNLDQVCMALLFALRVKLIENTTAS